MLGTKPTSAFLAFYVLAVIVAGLTSTDARSHHLRHHLRGGSEDRPRGRHRNNDNNNNNNNNNNDNNNNRGQSYGNQRSNHTSYDDNNNDDDDGDGDDVDGDNADLDYFYDEEEKVQKADGMTVPSLHAMQTFGLTPAGRKQRRPIRGSRKAVVVTKKTYLKKEWCKTQPLKQVIRMRGCLRTKILNNFCYGQCNSFFIPKKARRDKDAEAFLSCGFCRPRRFRWILVTLRCPSAKGLRFKRKRVQYIKKCRCMAQDVSMTPLS